MKILLCGANGQVGTEIHILGEKAGFEIIPMTEKELDITDKQKVNKNIQQHEPDLVINAAAYTAVDKAEQQQALCFAVNRDASINLAEACNLANIPLFHISTDYVFGGQKDAPYTEQDIPDPINLYGVSKWEGDQKVSQTIKQHIILRVAWVFGEYGNNFVKTMARLMQERDELGIVSDQLGSPTPARDIALTLLDLASRYQKDSTLPWGTYHYAGQPHVSWYQFAEAIKQQLGVNTKLNPIATSEYPTPAKRAANTRLDSSLITKTFGIKAPDWQHRLKEVLA